MAKFHISDFKEVRAELKLSPNGDLLLMFNSVEVLCVTKNGNVLMSYIEDSDVPTLRITGISIKDNRLQID